MLTGTRSALTGPNHFRDPVWARHALEQRMGRMFVDRVSDPKREAAVPAPVAAGRVAPWFAG
jgi:hypothetical protein